MALGRLAALCEALTSPTKINSSGVKLQVEKRSRAVRCSGVESTGIFSQAQQAGGCPTGRWLPEPLPTLGCCTCWLGMFRKETVLTFLAVVRTWRVGTSVRAWQPVSTQQLAHIRTLILWQKVFRVGRQMVTWETSLVQGQRVEPADSAGQERLAKGAGRRSRDVMRSAAGG